MYWYSAGTCLSILAVSILEVSLMLTFSSLHGITSLTVLEALASLIPRLCPPPVLITCGMQKWRRNAWEKESHSMTSGRHIKGGARLLLLTNFALISLKFTEQQAVLTLHFEHSSLKSLDKILQEGPQDFSSGTAPRVCSYLSLRHITMHVTKYPRPSPSGFAYCKCNIYQNWIVVKA